MNRSEIKARQKAERKKCLEEILRSDAKKKLIVSGPGTGKTFTFGELLRLEPGGTNLALTFIKRLVNDMEVTLSPYAETKTFHAYCKKILHQQNGKIELNPYLTKIVEKDAQILGKKPSRFDFKFYTLDETGGEIAFYLKRGDYYGVVSFNDAVYRIYKILKKKPDLIPELGQIVIDEYQDFNLLEISFIKELSKKGSILIVGDDDQAVYDNSRAASPKFLRNLHKAGQFTKFQLPFCNRCPEVIVEATNCLIKVAQRNSYFRDRIPKRYECYFEDKERDSTRYPRIIMCKCTIASVIPKYILKEISRIRQEDIDESNIEGKEYPTVLIVGQKQYLREIEKQLKPVYPQISYVSKKEEEYNIIEGYKLILNDEKSNFGWRILAEFLIKPDKLKRIISKSEKGKPIIDLLSKKFVENQLKVIEAIRVIQSGESLTETSKLSLKRITGKNADLIIEFFTPKEIEEEVEPLPLRILLTSFVGCKGLSVGHVFIVGANNGSIPRDPDDIKDIEISKFIVAMTRTRKQCHIITNKWLVAPVIKGRRVRPFDESIFTSWIPARLIENRGNKAAKDFK
ncbi:MAG: ATP-dependent helicase [Candidatus Omnitrophica bacterium]|nr:ATP-dependent helicase [Candidatus Omnitrophota bacterium]